MSRFRTKDRTVPSRTALLRDLLEARAEAEKWRTEARETAADAEKFITRQNAVIDYMATVLSSRRHRVASWLGRLFGWREVPRGLGARAQAPAPDPAAQAPPPTPGAPGAPDVPLPEDKNAQNLSSDIPK